MPCIISLAEWAANSGVYESIVDTRLDLLDAPHCKHSLFGCKCIIPGAVSERNNASTCILDIPPAGQSKTVSFQTGLPTNNDEIGDM